MSQVIFDTINPSTTSGTQLATILNDFKAAIVSGMSGTSRPTELEAGGGWVDTTDANLWIYNVYTGTNDVAIFTVNLTTGKSSFSGSDSTFEISRISADTVGPIAKFIKQRIATNGQVLAGDIVGEMQFVGRGSDSSNPIVARIRAYASDNMGAAASGAYFVFETTNTGTTAAAEAMRLIDGKLGVGTQSPSARLHAEGATGIKSSYTADSANPAVVTLEKSRVAGTKATQNADDIAEIAINTTDSLSAQAKSASIKATATQAHTNTARGTKITVATTDDGAATPTDKLTIGSKIESLVTMRVNSQELVAQSIATSATIAQLSATKAVVEFTGSTATSVQGINSGHASKVILIHNISTADITLEHENASATAADRLKLPNATFLKIAPQASIELFYSVTDSRWKLKSGSGTGSSGGGGTGKNYYGIYKGDNFNGDFEQGNLGANANSAGFQLGHISALTNGLPSGSITIGSGFSGNLSIGVTATSPLSGLYSLNYISSAATTVGNALVSKFFVDPSDVGRVLSFKFNYKATSNPGNANWSGTSSNSFGIGIYDNANATWVPMTGNFSMTQSSGVGEAKGTFQVPAGATFFYLFVYNANATSGAVTVMFDDFSVGPQASSIGSISTDWQSYLPTYSAGLGTVTNSAMQWRRVGASVEIRGTFQTGTVAGSAATFSMPSGLVSAATSPTNYQTYGDWEKNVVTGAAPKSGTLIVSSTPTNLVNFSWTDTAGSLDPLSAQNGNALFGNSQVVNVRASVPISGWSSTVQMSNDTDTRVVAFAGSSSGQTITNGGVDRQLNIGSVSTDTHGGVNGNTYVIPVSGLYLFDLGVSLNQATTGLIIAKYSVNGGTAVSVGAFVNLPQYTRIGSPRLIELKAGDVIRFYLNNGTSTASPLVDLQTFYLARLSGPATIAASESVTAGYMNLAGTAVGTSATVIPFATKEWDSHNAFNNANANAFTAPVSGKYQVSLVLTNNGVNLSTAQGFYADVYKNGSFYKNIGWTPGTGASNNHRAIGTVDVSLNAGEYIDIRATSSVATTLLTASGYNSLAIKKVGN